MWAVTSDSVPYGIPRAWPIEFNVVLHVIREPAAAVSSIAYTEQSTEAWRSKWVEIPADADPLERAVWSLYGWNQIISQHPPTHRAQLEWVERTVEEIAGPMRHHTDSNVLWFRRRPHPRLYADQIKASPWKHEDTARLWDGLVSQHAEAAS
jgi:hypothetical protein